MLFKGKVAELEAAAKEIHTVTTRLAPSDTVKTILKVWEGRMAAMAVGGSLLRAIAAGNEDHISEVSLPGDESWARLRLHVDAERTTSDSTVVQLSVDDYELFQQMGVPKTAGLAAALGKLKKATEKLQPTSVTISN